MEEKNKNKIDLVLNILYKVFFAVAILIIILLISTKLPLPGNLQILIVRSGSMEPAIKTGSIVAVKPASEYKVGDIITFDSGRHDKVPTTHRIVEIKEENGIKSFVTKGDANETVDLKEISEKNIIGKALVDIPYIGYVATTARKPIGFILIIVIPALLVIYDEALKIVRELRKKAGKKQKIKEDDNKK